MPKNLTPDRICWIKFGYSCFISRLFFATSPNVFSNVDGFMSNCRQSGGSDSAKPSFLTSYTGHPISLRASGTGMMVTPSISVPRFRFLHPGAAHNSTTPASSASRYE